MRNARTANNHAGRKRQPEDRFDARKLPEPRRPSLVKQNLRDTKTRIASPAARMRPRDTPPSLPVKGRSFVPSEEAYSLQQAEIPEPPAACISRSFRRGQAWPPKNLRTEKPESPRQAHVGETGRSRAVLFARRHVLQKAWPEVPPMPPWQRGPGPRQA